MRKNYINNFNDYNYGIQNERKINVISCNLRMYIHICNQGRINVSDKYIETRNKSIKIDDNYYISKTFNNSTVYKRKKK